MICRSCSEGTALYGDDPGGVMWKAFHDKCKGETHCDCQHVPIARVRRVTEEEKERILSWADQVESFVERQRSEHG